MWLSPAQMSMPVGAARRKGLRPAPRLRAWASQSRQVKIKMAITTAALWRGDNHADARRPRRRMTGITSARAIAWRRLRHCRGPAGSQPNVFYSARYGGAARAAIGGRAPRGVETTSRSFAPRRFGSQNRSRSSSQAARRIQAFSISTRGAYSYYTYRHLPGL